MPVFHGHLPWEPQSVPATSQVCHAPWLSRSSNSQNPPQEVLGRTSSYPSPLSYQLVLEETVNLWSQLWWSFQVNPREPLHFPQILDPSREGCIQRKGQGSPPATPGDASFSIPEIFVWSDPAPGVAMGL